MPDLVKPLLAASLLVGCQGGVSVEDNPTEEEERPWPAEETRAAHRARGAPTCPRADDVRIEATADTVALAFRTGGDPAPLRGQVREVGAAYRQLDGAPQLWVSRDAEQPGVGAGRVALPDAQVAYEELPDGARLVFTPAAPADHEALVEALREHQRRLSRGMCMTPMAEPPPAPMDEVGWRRARPAEGEVSR